MVKRFILILLVLATVTQSFATDGTYPSSKPLNNNESILKAISKDEPILDLGSYLNYKKITRQEIQALEWSFILSQMATPLEESLEDVLNHDIVLQMKDTDLSITNSPDIIDKDYVYLDVGEFIVSSSSFKEVHKIITDNIRYNALLDENLNHYTVEAFYGNNRKGTVGYVSDYVYTDKKSSTQLDNEELKNNISNLLNIDSKDKCQSLIEFYEKPELLISKDFKDSVIGQRRLVPVFIGSTITDFYLQLGITIYCRNNPEGSNTFNRFIEDYGNCRVYIDSFGNICFYDSALSKYKIILPNALNPIFTSNSDTEELSLYSDNYLDLIETGGENLEYIDKTINYSRNDLFKNYNYETWNEKTFIYNKWIGSMYSINRKSNTDSDYMGEITDDQDVQAMYYPNYVGTISNNRYDYRNSLVFMRAPETYLNPTKIGYGNDGSIRDFFNGLFSGIFSEDTELIKITEDGDWYKSNIQNKHKTGSGASTTEKLMMNSLLHIGKNTTVFGVSKEQVYTNWLFMQNGLNAILQTPKDTMIPKNEQNEILSGKNGGGIVVNIPEYSLRDVENNSLLGTEGGFLEEYKRIGSTEIYIDPKTQQEIEFISDEFSSTYLVKRDNRISNRFENYPVDDISILSYVWFNDYLNRYIFKEFSVNGEYQIEIDKYISETGLKDISLLPFNLDTSIEELNVSVYPDYNKDIVIKFYNDLKNGNSYSELPYTASTYVEPYATLMAIYRNTDSTINNNNPVKVIGREKLVDREMLAKKVDFSYTNPIDAVGNFISSVAQSIHNIFAVNTSGDLFELIGSYFKNEKFINLLTFIFILCISATFIAGGINLLRGKNKLRDIASDTLTISFIILLIPLTYNISFSLNRMLIREVSELSIDKTNLISVSQAFKGLTNKDIQAEENYQVYRQQFKNINQVFSDTTISIPKGYDTKDGYKYEYVEVDDAVLKLLFKNPESSNNTWFSSEKFNEVNKLRYSEDITYYFYDYFMYQYLKYNSENETPVTTIVHQFSTDIVDIHNQEKMEKLDKIIHNIDGGLSKLMEDEPYLNSTDVFGIYNLFNYEDKNSIITNNWFILEQELKEDLKMKTVIDGDNYFKPYFKQGLNSLSSGERTEFKVDDLLQGFKYEHKLDRDLKLVNKKIIDRVKALVEYRQGEFKDTSIIYLASVIASEEMANKFTDFEYGFPKSFNIDKILRVAYTKNFDKIVNTEPFMYIVQDTIIGGMFLNIFILIYEIIHFIITLMSGAINIVISLVFPFIIVQTMKSSDEFRKHQMLGIATQIFGSLVSVFLINLPILIFNKINNVVISDLTYWIFTLVAVIWSLIPLNLSFTLFKYALGDRYTLGGSIVQAEINDLVTRVQGGNLSFEEGVTVQDSSVSVLGEEITLGSTTSNINISEGAVSIDVISKVVDNNLIEQYEYREDLAYADNSDKDNKTDKKRE